MSYKKWERYYINGSLRQPIVSSSFSQYNFASDVYEKLKDYRSLAILYATTKQWKKVIEIDHVNIVFNNCLGL